MELGKFSYKIRMDTLWSCLRPLEAGRAVRCGPFALHSGVKVPMQNSGCRAQSSGNEHPNSNIQHPFKFQTTNNDQACNLQEAAIARQFMDFAALCKPGRRRKF